MSLSCLCKKLTKFTFSLFITSIFSSGLSKQVFCSMDLVFDLFYLLEFLEDSFGYCFSISACLCSSSSSIVIRPSLICFKIFVKLSVFFSNNFSLLMIFSATTLEKPPYVISSSIRLSSKGVPPKILSDFSCFVSL